MVKKKLGSKNQPPFTSLSRCALLIKDKHANEY